MHRRVKTVMAVTVIGVLTTCLSACGGEGSAGGAKDYKVLYLLPTLSDEAYSREAAGAQAQAKKYENFTLDIQAGAQRQDPTKQVSKIEDAVTKGYDAIIVDAGEAAAQLSPTLNTAKKEGVDIITIVHEIPDLDATVQLAFDQKAVYKVAGEYMSETLLPDGGEIGIITCVASNADSKARIEGFKSGLAANVKEVAFGDAKCDPAKARSITENMLTAHPNIKGIFNNTDLATVGTVEALRAAGKDLAVIGGDGQTPNLKFMESKDIQDAAVRYPSETFGSLAVEAAYKLANGEKVPASEPVPGLPLITQENAAEVLKEVKALVADNS